MSMSQEEIEALMSGAGDVSLDDDEEEEASSSDESESKEEEQEELTDPVIEDVDPISTEGENETIEEQESQDDEVKNDETEEAIENGSSHDMDDDDINDVLAGIDGVVDDEPENQREQKIDENQYPLPVSNENKVVNQLNQVADDSEEKASQIFDVLSFILDENNEIAAYNKSMGEFIQRQTKLLTALSTKFPNIDIFQTNLEIANELVEVSGKLSGKIDGENNKVFEAMELMQYHDINRQKIERVMAVIRKLNSYLNGIFEDESDRPEVQIAKHIPGDSNEVVDADDLESLINQFAQEEGQ